MADPCADQRGDFYASFGFAALAIGGAALGVAAAPVALGLAVAIGATAGATGGLTIAMTHWHWSNCLRDHGLHAQADVLQSAGQQLQAEADALYAAAVASGGTAIA